MDTGHLPWGLEDLGLFPPILLFCVLDSSGLPTSINIHAHLPSQGASSQDKLHLDSGLAVEPRVCGHPGCTMCEWPVT